MDEFPRVKFDLDQLRFRIPSEVNRMDLVRFSVGIADIFQNGEAADPVVTEENGEIIIRIFPD